MSEEKTEEKNEERKLCKIFLNVPYNKKDMVKELWFRFDGVRKCWYIQVRGIYDVDVLTPIIFLFNYVDIEGVNMDEDDKEKI